MMHVNDGKGKFSIRQIISSDYGDQCGCETLATADTRPPSQIDTNHHPILISEQNREIQVDTRRDYNLKVTGI
jgi:hypothetical protein